MEGITTSQTSDLQRWSGSLLRQRAGTSRGQRQDCALNPATPDATIRSPFVVYAQAGASKDRETERADPPDNVVRLSDIRRCRRSTAEVSQPITSPAGAAHDDDPPPDAA